MSNWNDVSLSFCHSVVRIYGVNGFISERLGFDTQSQQELLYYRRQDTVVFHCVQRYYQHTLISSHELLFVFLPIIFVLANRPWLLQPLKVLVFSASPFPTALLASSTSTFATRRLFDCCRSLKRHLHHLRRSSSQVPQLLNNYIFATSSHPSHVHQSLSSFDSTGCAPLRAALHNINQIFDTCDSCYLTSEFIVQPHLSHLITWKGTLYFLRALPSSS